MMTQGDLTSVTLTHWRIALSTGGLTAVFVTLLAVTGIEFNKLTRSIACGVAVFGADLAQHGTHFGAGWTEALATAAMSSGLAYLAGNMISRE